MIITRHRLITMLCVSLAASFPRLLPGQDWMVEVQATLVTADTGSPVTLVTRGSTASGTILEL